MPVVDSERNPVGCLVKAKDFIAAVKYVDRTIHCEKSKENHILTPL